MKRTLGTVGTVCTLCTLACSPSLPNADGALVDKLRILALRADPPEVSPGKPSALDALVSDPKGAGRALTYTWLACDPNVRDFYGTSCSDERKLADLAALAAAPGTHALGAATTSAYTPPADVFAALAKDSPIRFFGSTADAVLVVSAGSFADAASGKVEAAVAVVHIAVSELPANVQNANPPLAPLRVGTMDVDAGTPLAPDEASLCAVAGAGASQVFYELDPESPMGFRMRNEALFAEWHTTTGTLTELPDAGLPADPNLAVLHGCQALSAPDAKAGDAIDVVLRDGRGGVSFARWPLAR